MSAQRNVEPMQELEPRILFDAMLDLPCEPSCPTGCEEPILPEDAVEVSQVQTEAIVQLSQLVLVDSRLEDVDQLVSEIVASSAAPVDIRVIDQESNGLTQVSRILEESGQPFSAVHLLSHGKDGSLQFGESIIGVEELTHAAAEIENWTDKLTEHADFLFYGCNLAESESGVEFLDRFQQLTGADVAASDDITGHRALQGDWDLEFRSGVIETQALSIESYQHTLGPGEILGTVNDVTTEDAGGVEGVTVTVFDDDNNIVGTATSDESGAYLIGGLADGQRYRVVFEGGPEGYQSAGVSAFDSGSVVFAAAGGAEVDFNMHRPLDYCESNPELAVSCFIIGTHDGLASNMAAIVATEHDFSEDSDKRVLATIGQVGSTFGMAYQPSSDIIYSASFLKRNTGFGPEGMDAIYLIDATNGGYSNTSDGAKPIAINLSDFGIDVGTELSDDDRGLSDDPNDLVLDQWGWDNQFRLGIGDIDISDDGNTLYVMNLNDHDGDGRHGQLVILDISDPENVSLRGTVDIPNLIPGVQDVDLRAFATKFENGNLYIGVTGTAESTQDRGDLRAAVYQLDSTETTFSLVAIDSTHVFGDNSGPTDHIRLDYDRGLAYELDDDNHSADFQPWTNDSSLYDTSGGFLSRPQPLLTDIEFDDDGSMILAFANRDAYQLGQFDIYPGGGGDTRPGLVAGELLRVQKTDTGFELEGGDAAPSNATGPDHLGPNGGEFYFRDNFFSLHEEVTMGALALLPGSGQVVTTVVDPLAVNSGGLSRLSNTTGGDRSDLELYNLNDPGSAAKGAGLGDLEVICRAAPVEIGNYIWFDADADGIQDAGESALANVLVGLYDDTGTLIATVETDSNGRYLFSSASGENINQDNDGIAEMAYGLDICADDCVYTVGVLDSNFENGNALNGFEITLSNQSGTANDSTDHSDSDAVDVQVGAAESFSSSGVSLVTSGAGVNNHTFDFGFFQATVEPPPVDPEVPPTAPNPQLPSLPPVVPPFQPFLPPTTTSTPIEIPPLTLDPNVRLAGGVPIDSYDEFGVCECVEVCGETWEVSACDVMGDVQSEGAGAASDCYPGCDEVGSLESGSLSQVHEVVEEAPPAPIEWVETSNDSILKEDLSDGLPTEDMIEQIDVKGDVENEAGEKHQVPHLHSILDLGHIGSDLINSIGRLIEPEFVWGGIHPKQPVMTHLDSN